MKKGFKILKAASLEELVKQLNQLRETIKDDTMISSYGLVHIPSRKKTDYQMIIRVW